MPQPELLHGALTRLGSWREDTASLSHSEGPRRRRGTSTSSQQGPVAQLVVDTDFAHFTALESECVTPDEKHYDEEAAAEENGHAQEPPKPRFRRLRRIRQALRRPAPTLREFVPIRFPERESERAFQEEVREQGDKLTPAVASRQARRAGGDVLHPAVDLLDDRHHPGVDSVGVLCMWLAGATSLTPGVLWLCRLLHLPVALHDRVQHLPQLVLDVPVLPRGRIVGLGLHPAD